MLRPEERKLELIVGTVSLIIILLTIAGVMWANKYHLFSTRRYYVVRFGRASGLQEGDPVTVSGVPKGVVSDFIVRKDSVDVIIAVDKDIQLYTDASAIISNQQLLGSKKIEINPGISGMPLPEMGLFRGTFAGGIEDLFETVGGIATSIQRLVKTLDITFTKVNRLLDKEIPADLQGVRRTTERVEKLLDGEVKPSLVALRQTLQESHSFLTGEKEKVSGIIDNLQTITRDLQGLLAENKGRFAKAVKNLDEAGRNLAVFSQQLKDPNSSLGRLSQSDSLYAQLEAVVNDIQGLVEDIRKNPGRYLKHVNVTVDMFGGSKKK